MEILTYVCVCEIFSLGGQSLPICPRVISTEGKVHLLDLQIQFLTYINEAVTNKMFKKTDLLGILIILWDNHSVLNLQVMIQIGNILMLLSHSL